MKTQNRPGIVLKFPEQCENDLQCYRRVINDYWKSIDATDHDVLFDCGDVCFIRPLGGNILALLIRGLLQQGSRKVFLTDPNKYNQACHQNLGVEMLGLVWMFCVITLNILVPWRSFLLMVYSARNPMGLH